VQAGAVEGTGGGDALGGRARRGLMNVHDTHR
jgi:hypothetical protein